MEAHGLQVSDQRASLIAEELLGGLGLVER